MYILIGIQVIAGLWAYFDARGRQHSNAILWGIGAWLLPIVFVPIYWARRNLHHGEVRDGGFAWNFCKYFAALWTVWLIAAGISGFFEWTGIVHQIKYNSRVATTVVGLGIALFIYAALFWAVTTGIALGIGRILKRSDAVQKGPTGALAAMDGPTALK